VGECQQFGQAVVAELENGEYLLLGKPYPGLQHLLAGDSQHVAGRAGRVDLS
jgi:hypothetical protein